MSFFLAILNNPWQNSILKKMQNTFLVLINSVSKFDTINGQAKKIAKILSVKH